MTADLIKEIKHIQQCLINKEMMGDDLAEKMEAVKKLLSHEKTIGLGAGGGCLR